MTVPGTVEHVTCLGCGCACDDIRVTVHGGRIVEADNACSLGLAWFGDGVVPWRALVRGRTSTVEQALDATAAVLTGARRPLVYLAPDLSCEVQRQTVAVADVLRPPIDSVTSVVGSARVASCRGQPLGCGCGDDVADRLPGGHRLRAWISAIPSP
jgi:formylmethanofuran dehydrogenase subunit B